MASTATMCLLAIWVVMIVYVLARMTRGVVRRICHWLWPGTWMLTRGENTSLNGLVYRLEEDFPDDMLDLEDQRGHRYAAFCAREARSKFGPGLRKRTEAMDMVVHKFVYDLMHKHGMRTSDIAREVPVAIALAYVPTSSDILAAKLSAASAVVDANRYANANWLPYKKQSWLWWRNSPQASHSKVE